MRKRRRAAIASAASEESEERWLSELCMTPGVPPEGDRSASQLAIKLPGLVPEGTTTSAIVELMGRLRCNLFSFGDEAGRVIGVGCYPRAAIMNHSCAPNCVVSYGKAGALLVRTACDVGVGTELCHSYADLCIPSRRRRETLRRVFGFGCTCTRCKDGVACPGGERLDDVLEAGPNTGLPAAQPRPLTLTLTLALNLTQAFLPPEHDAETAARRTVAEFSRAEINLTLTLIHTLILTLTLTRTLTLIQVPTLSSLALSSWPSTRR